jgi:hypothetical protein
MAIQFAKAVKAKAKGRVALVGPAGAGKTWTALTLATVLAGPRRIAFVCTEHGSAKKYGDRFDFDVVEPDRYAPEVFLEAMEAAEAGGYGVFVCDSLSHFWMGAGGALEFVDEQKKRSRDQMEGWKNWRPHERKMIDAIIAAPIHVIVTMRTKNEYQEVTDQQTGKKKRQKVGLAPVQREGLEYEFDLVGYMDDENNLVVDKTRCPDYAGRVLSKPKAADFAPLAAWLEGGVDLAEQSAKLTAAIEAKIGKAGSKETLDAIAKEINTVKPTLAEHHAAGLREKWKAALGRLKVAAGVNGQADVGDAAE